MKRRDVLRMGAAGLALPAMGAHLFGADEPAPKRVGLIGPGWYGRVDVIRLLQVLPTAEVVSVCDVDAKMLAEAAEIIGNRQASKKKPRTYADFRQMLGEKDLDIVLIATPDHWHALTMIAACEAGADIYVQKPVSVDVTEGQAMVAAARKHGRVVQVGTQRRSTPHLIECKKRVLDEKLLGKIGLVEIYCYYHMRASQPVRDAKPPESLDFEMWTGPAPLLPYQPVMHPRGWRSFREFSNGIVGDMCVHMLDMVRWMMDLGWPKRVGSEGGIFMDKKSVSNISDTQTATFEYDDLSVVWQHRTWGDAPNPKVHPWGATFYGEKGTLVANVQYYEFTPAGSDRPTLRGEALYEYDKFPEDRTEKDLERHVASAVRGHMTNLLDCIKTRGKPVADIEQGYISTASCILANLSMDLGRTLAWGPAAGKVIGDDEANQRLTRPYRAPWKHPSVS